MASPPYYNPSVVAYELEALPHPDNHPDKIMRIMAFEKRVYDDAATAKGKQIWVRCEKDDVDKTYIRLDRWTCIPRVNSEGKKVNRYFVRTKWVTFDAFKTHYRGFKLPYKESCVAARYAATMLGGRNSDPSEDDDDDDEDGECSCTCGDEFDHYDWKELHTGTGFPFSMPKSLLREAWMKEFASN